MNANQQLYRVPLAKNEAWTAYLDGKGPEANCSTCRDFVSRYGTLVGITPQGTLESAIWDQTNPTIKALVEAYPYAPVPFFTQLAVLGTPVTGEHTHLHLEIPEEFRYKPYKNMDERHRADQVMTHYKLLVEGLKTITLDELIIIKGLNGYELNRKDRLQQQLEWTRQQMKNVENTNLLLQAVLTAKRGYFNPLSRDFGFLLQQIRQNKDVTMKDLEAAWNGHVRPYPQKKAEAVASSL